MIAIDGPSLHLGRIFGIPIKVHWSFSLFIAFISYVAYRDQIPQSQLLGFYSYVFLLFVFVIMHEFGHALAGRKYGIVTRDIIISPIGGIARLEALPENPFQELVIAIAGPAVNVVLAIIFFLFQIQFSDSIFPSDIQLNFNSWSDYVGYLLVINVVLVVFNLIPAFPMDGGRVLRALLDMGMKNRYLATQWAVRIGQILAICFIIYGVSSESYMLSLIGIFVFVSGRSELKQLRILKAMKTTTALEIMQPRTHLLNIEDTIEEVIQQHGKKNYLVADKNGNTIGALPVLFINKAIKQKKTQLTVGETLIKSKGPINQKMSLKDTFDWFNLKGQVIVEVEDDDGNKKGVIDRQLLSDFIRSI